MRRLSESFVETLAAIHAVDATDPALAALGTPEGYVARQVDGWSEALGGGAHRRRAGDRPDGVVAGLAPAARRAARCLVHNDYKYDNLVLDPADLSRIVAVLDWEMATLGDPLLDLGTSLGYWVEEGDHPALRSLGLGVTALPGNFNRRELWERYLERTGRPPTDPTFYRVFGLVKIAVIAQQIYFRYRRGFSTDDRFARLGDAVRLFAVTAEVATTGSAI